MAAAAAEQCEEPHSNIKWEFFLGKVGETHFHLPQFGSPKDGPRCNAVCIVRLSYVFRNCGLKLNTNPEKMKMTKMKYLLVKPHDEHQL